jgi:hypothetical protein
VDLIQVLRCRVDFGWIIPDKRCNKENKISNRFKETRQVVSPGCVISRIDFLFLEKLSFACWSVFDACARIFVPTSDTIGPQKRDIQQTEEKNCALDGAFQFVASAGQKGPDAIFRHADMRADLAVGLALQMEHANGDGFFLG